VFSARFVFSVHFVALMMLKRAEIVDAARRGLRNEAHAAPSARPAGQPPTIE